MENPWLISVSPMFQVNVMRKAMEMQMSNHLFLKITCAAAVKDGAGATLWLGSSSPATRMDHGYDGWDLPIW